MNNKAIKYVRMANVKDASRVKRTRKNQLTSLIIHEQIVTETAKAKKLSADMDRLIQIAKVDTVANRRLVAARIRDVDANEKQTAVQKVFELAKKYTKRNGGYTRVLKYATRKGDGVQTAIISFV